MALKINDQKVFDKVVSDAIEKAISTCETEALAKRWENAIDRAVEEIARNPYLDYDTEKGELLIMTSSPSNNIYTSNGVCQCLSFRNGKKPCWHRAAARLWRTYLEAENTPPPAKAAAAVAASSKKYPEIFYRSRARLNAKKLETAESEN